jgi:hypothetical protein
MTLGGIRRSEDVVQLHEGIPQTFAEAEHTVRVRPADPRVAHGPEGDQGDEPRPAEQGILILGQLRVVEAESAGDHLAQPVLEVAHRGHPHGEQLRILLQQFAPPLQ